MAFWLDEYPGAPQAFPSGSVVDYGESVRLAPKGVEAAMGTSIPLQLPIWFPPPWSFENLQVFVSCAQYKIRWNRFERSLTGKMPRECR